MVVGLGGGKAIDVAKVVAKNLNASIVVVPTIASTDSPTSAVAVTYTEEGVFDETIKIGRNPNVVLMDTKVIAQAPVRLFVAGMGDALATYFEARMVTQTRNQNLAGGLPTNAAMSLAKLSYELLISDGYKAKLAVEKGTVNHSVENVIEPNTLLSGLGF